VSLQRRREAQNLLTPEELAQAMIDPPVVQTAELEQKFAQAAAAIANIDVRVCAVCDALVDANQCIVRTEIPLQKMRAVLTAPTELPQHLKDHYTVPGFRGLLLSKGLLVCGLVLEPS
jgi:hypothetical protein